MAYDMVSARCPSPVRDSDGWRAEEADLPPPSPSRGGREAGSINWEPAARPLRYSERPMPLGTRLFGLGGTGMVGLLIVGMALFKWTTAPPPIAPATLSVFDVTPPVAPPEPPSEVPPDPERQEKQMPLPRPDRPQDEPPQIQIPSDNPMTVPVAQPVPDPGPPIERMTAPETKPAPPAQRVSTGKPTWEGLVLGALNKKKRYPRDAQFRREHGVPYIRFVMDRDGRVLSARLERSSGFPALDQEALALPMRAQPLPKPPESVTGDRIELVVPVEFFMS